MLRINSKGLLDLDRLSYFKITYLLAYILFMLSNCNLTKAVNKNEKSYSKNKDELHIKDSLINSEISKQILLNSTSVNSISFFDIFNNLEYISVGDSVYKPKQLSNLKFVDSCFYFLEKTYMRILKVKPDGTIKIILDNYGPEINKYTYITDFDVSTNEHRILILEPWGNIFEYDSTPKFINKMQVNLRANHYIHSEDSIVYLYSSTEPVKIHKFNLSNSLTPIKDTSPFFFRKTLTVSDKSPFYYDNSILHYYHSGWDELYTLVGDKCQSILKVNFVSGGFDYFFKTDDPKDISEIKIYFETHPNEIWEMNFIYKFDSIYLGNYLLGTKNKKTFYIDKLGKTKTFQKFDEGIQLPSHQIYKYDNNLYALLDPIKDPIEQYANESILASEQLKNLKNIQNEGKFIILKYTIN